jgi:hypothetical protein
MNDDLVELDFDNRWFFHADVLTKISVQLIIWEKESFAFFTFKCLTWCEKVDFDFVLFLIMSWIVVVQIEIELMIILVVFIMWIIHLVILIVLFDYVCSFFFLVISFSILVLILALSFLKWETWRVLIRIFVSYLKRLSWRRQDKNETCRFFSEESSIREKVSIVSRWVIQASVSILIFEAIVLTRDRILIEELIICVNVLIIKRKRKIRSKRIFWIILSSTSIRVLKSISIEFLLISELNRVISCQISDMKLSWSRNFLIDVMIVDSRMLIRKCQSRLFHAMISWLWIEFMLTVLIERKICCANSLEFFLDRASIIVYLKFCRANNVNDVRFLKRFVIAWYQNSRLVWRRKSFFISNNFVKCQIRAALRKHCDSTTRNLSSSRILIIFLSRSTKT